MECFNFFRKIYLIICVIPVTEWISIHRYEIEFIRLYQQRTVFVGVRFDQNKNMAHANIQYELTGWKPLNDCYGLNFNKLTTFFFLEYEVII